MEFRVLGPLEARADGALLPLGGPRQRAIFAYLLLHANEVVSADRLLDEVWFDLPEHGAAAVHTQISRLRKVLGDRLVSSGRGYALRVEPQELDLQRVRALLAEAGAAESHAERARLLREAEALWVGDPLRDVDAPFVPGESAALEELRLAAIEERIAAELDCGRAAELVPEIALLVAQQPLRERLRMQQILALYRAGRQAAALEAYRDARTTLDEELGLEPSPALRELERAVLRQDASLDMVAALPVVPPRPRRRRALVAGALVACAGIGGVVASVVVGGSPQHRTASRVVTRVVDRETTVVAQVRRTVRPVTVRRARHAKPAAVTTTVVAPIRHTTTHATTAVAQHATTSTRAATTLATTTVQARKPAVISDDFTGTQIDPTIWYQIATGTGWSVTQQNGTVEWSFDAGAQPGGPYDQIGGHLGTQCKFPGDFDARVDFSLPVWPDANGVIVNLWVFFQNVGYATWRRSDPQYGDGYGSYTGPGAGSNVPIHDTTGSLRIARHDGVLTTYFLHDGVWDALTSTTRPGWATIAIGASAGGADFGRKPVVVDLKNFSMTGNDPACPPGSQPHG